MNSEHYAFKASPISLNFEFESMGPMGSIKKLVTYDRTKVGNISFFSLAFGDLNEEEGTFDDTITSNNGDRDKILSTIAATILTFTRFFPEAAVFATGSNAVRTRLYQMKIATHLSKVEEIFDVRGYVNHNWEPFRKNVNYDCFLIKRKEILKLGVILKV